MRRFDASAPDGRHFEWVERQFADGVRLAIARDVTRHVRAADDALRAKTTLQSLAASSAAIPLGALFLTGFMMFFLTLG